MLRASVAALAVATASAHGAFQVQELRFGAPASPNLATALEFDGFIALTHVPNLAAARKQALVQAAQCVLDHGGDAPVTVTLKDFSVRSSWGAFTTEPFPSTPACPGLDRALEELRNVITLGTNYFVSRLDADILEPGSHSGIMAKMEGGGYATFQSLFTDAVHLDHVHVYEKRAVTEELSLEFHTDQGIFICVVPAVRLLHDGSVSFQEDSFLVETRSGERVIPTLPQNDDVLLFMMGDGSRYLVANALKSGFRPVPHAVKLDASQQLSARAWMGRMFFAPADALLHGGVTFQSVIDKVIVARETNMVFPLLSCDYGKVDTETLAFRMLHDVSGNNCSEGTAFCWMGCVWKGDATCEDPQCLRVDGTVLPDGEFDGDARLKCPSIVSQSSAEQFVNPLILTLVVLGASVIEL